MVCNTLRRIALSVVVLAAPVIPGSGANAEPEGVVSITLGSVQGLVWLDGGLLSSAGVGDELHAVGEFLPNEWFPLPWDTGQYAHTFWIHGAQAVDDRIEGDWRRIDYGPGTIGIYRAPLPGAFEYGTSPPNATCPASFQAGELAIEGSFPAAFFWLHEVTRTGLLSFGMSYSGGSLLDEATAACLDCEVYADFSLSSTAADSIPQGFDTEVTGSIWNSYLAVEPSSWARVKAGYR